MEKKIVLLVEDNLEDVELTQATLKLGRLNLHLEVMHDGQSALDYLFAAGAYAGRDRTDLPVAVLLDLKLPKLDGIETLTEIRKRSYTKLMPVVMLTSSDYEPDIIQSYVSGANSFVRKPLEFNKYIEIIHEICRYWSEINTFPPAFKN